MKAMIVIVSLICFVPPIIAVFDIIRKLGEQKYQDDAQDLFYKEIVKAIDEQKNSKAKNEAVSDQPENIELPSNISENEQKKEVVHGTLISDVKEEITEDKTENKKESDPGIEKEAALEIVMNMLKTNRDNKKETTSGELDSMISILNEAKKNNNQRE